MTGMYKILTGKYDKPLVPKFQLATNSVTRGSFLKLATFRPKYDTCKYSFAVRSVKLWNSLPNHVIRGESINSFKNRLDRHRKKMMSYIMIIGYQFPECLVTDINHSIVHI